MTFKKHPTKLCQRCKNHKLRNEFPITKRVSWTSLSPYCCACTAEAKEMARIKNNAHSCEWQKLNRDRLNAKARANHLKNPDKRREASRKHRRNNREKIIERRNELRNQPGVKKKQNEASYRYNKRHPDRKRASWLKWYRSHAKQQSEKRRARKTRDIQYKLTVNLRRRINSVLKKGWKSASTLQLLGCSYEDFKAHLERLFTKDMNWSNYGSYWHLDHIRPCVSFDLADPEQQRICFNWSNLRPLEAKTNVRKDATKRRSLYVIKNLPANGSTLDTNLSPPSGST